MNGSVRRASRPHGGHVEMLLGGRTNGAAAGPDAEGGDFACTVVALTAAINNINLSTCSCHISTIVIGAVDQAAGAGFAGHVTFGMITCNIAS